MAHFLRVLRGEERPSSEFRLGRWEHSTRPSPAAITYLKNGVEFYAESRVQFRPFLDTVTGDYSSPATTHETFRSVFYRDLLVMIEAEFRRLPLDAETEHDHDV